MQATGRSWDYLIVTASNEAQAKAYEVQLAVRRELGLLSDIGETIVVADPGGGVQPRLNRRADTAYPGDVVPGEKETGGGAVGERVHVGAFHRHRVPPPLRVIPGGSF